MVRMVGRNPDGSPAWPKQIWTHEVRKRNRRLEVYRVESDETVYTPPDFLRIDNRGQLMVLADRLTAGVRPIIAIMEFEASRPHKATGESHWAKS